MKRITLGLAATAAALVVSASPAAAAPANAPQCIVDGAPIPAYGPCQAYSKSGNNKLGGAYRAQCDLIVNVMIPGFGGPAGYPNTLYTPGDAKNRGTCLNTLRRAHLSVQGG